MTQNVLPTNRFCWRHCELEGSSPSKWCLNGSTRGPVSPDGRVKEGRHPPNLLISSYRLIIHLILLIILFDSFILIILVFVLCVLRVPESALARRHLCRNDVTMRHHYSASAMLAQAHPRNVTFILIVIFCIFRTVRKSRTRLSSSAITRLPSRRSTSWTSVCSWERLVLNVLITAFSLVFIETSKFVGRF